MTMGVPKSKVQGVCVRACVRACVSGAVMEKIPVRSGLRQGCALAPTSLHLYFSAVVSLMTLSF